MSLRIPRSRIVLGVVLAGVAVVLVTLARLVSGPPHPFQSAIALQQLDRLRELVDAGNDVNAIMPNGDQPLHYACRLAKVKAARALLELGADPAGHSAAGRTPWEDMWHDGRNGHFTSMQSEVLNALVEFGFVPTGPTGPEGATLLHCVAARTRNESLITRLVNDQGYDVAAVDDYGWTPLHAAANGRNYEGCKALLALGADVNAESTRTKENEALKEYLRVKDLNRGINAGDGIPLSTDFVKDLPGSVNRSYYRYDSGSRPLDVASKRLRRMEPDLPRLLEQQGGTRNTLVQNKIEDDSPPPPR
jgi:ankyrin repeat protein